ncbi:MAG: hypothetical protein AAB430_00045 [Patescibacteria group bacterium]
MLTKQDLTQIKKIVRDEVVSEAKNTERNLRSEIKLSRIEIQNDLSGVTDRLINLEQQTNKNFKTVNKKLDRAIDFFDHEHLDLQKRVKRIETNLHLPILADY